MINAALSDVPIFTIKNNNNKHPVGPNGYNKWRKMCETIDQIDTFDISNTQLPWMSLYKTHKDLLKIDLVTTVGYDISNNTAQFMRGFPLMLQGPDSQFNTGDISSNNWEYNWTFYKEHVKDFSGNLTENNVNNWLSNNNTSGNSQVITDFNNENRRNLLILDLSGGFYLHNNNDQEHLISEAGYNYINNKTRPDYLVIRLDTAIEESSFNKDNIHGKARDDLMVFNYVYSGYVISPYDFMANFTTDYLRSEKDNENYYINRDNPYTYKTPKEAIKDTIQLMNNKGIWEDAYVLGQGENKKIAKSHNKIISPFRYNFHLFPSQLEVFDFLDVDGQNILDADVSNNPIGPVTDVYDISQNYNTKINQSRFNTIESTLSNYLGPHTPNSNDNWTYHIENLIWCSLSSSRHTLYAKKDIKKKLYIGNYLNINEVEYDEYGNYLGNEITFDASGNITSAHENSNYMPTFKKASGSIIRDFSTAPMVGLNEVNMPRKTLTPYYKVKNRYNDYAFNWKYTNNGWSTSNNDGIEESTNKIDVNNCTVVEYRNLVEFKADMSIKYTFDKDKKTTFVTSANPMSDVWKGDVKLDNNNIKACDANGDQLSDNDLRLLDNGLNNEYFKVEWSGTDLSANTSKYGYLIDVASGFHEVTTVNINSNTTAIDNFLSVTTDIDIDKFKIISRVFQIRLDKLTDNNEIDYSGNKTINYNIDSAGADVAIYSYPNNNNNNDYPLFGYLNFIGIRSTELLGNAENYITIKNVFSNNTNDQTRIETREPYFQINDQTVFKQAYMSTSKIVYNSNIFYARTNFTSSNVILSDALDNPGFDDEILFKNKTSISWRNGYTNGLEITEISNQQINNTNDIGIKLRIFSTDTKLFITSVVGKSNRNHRTLDSTQNTIHKSIELNNNLKMEYIDSGTITQKNIKFNFLQFDNINFCSSQGNLFLSDFWKWSEPLVSASQPESSYEGPPNTIVNRNLSNRYNVYNWDDTDDITVDDNIYNTGLVHNPQLAFENQSLINFIVELSSISINYSHVLVNTWRGAKIGNKFQSIGIKSFTNSEGTFVKDSNPVFKIKILGGDQITPTIETTPAIFDISANAKFNFATNLDNNDEAGNSKAPSNINEADGTLINFTNAPFTTATSKGWFAKTGFDSSRNGIFRDTTGAINKYSTIDFSSNIISDPPTKLSLIDSYGDPISGRFSKEEQEFPLELLFCYPYDIPELVPEIPKPYGYTTTYINSDGVTTTKTFTDFKGHKRFSNIYAISLTGSSSDGNENFKKRLVFPENIIINCVELPPPLQVNNSNDMLAFDNNSVKIVWKGYNFSQPSNNFRSTYGDTGDIIWKIERFQTQLGIRKTLYNDKITPDDGYSLSTYTFIDNSIRIYDKYIYTVTGTYEYKFKRVFVNTNSNTLSLNFGSFNTDEIIICKNNKFEYGRYNTTSTNLKLFRPLLIKREGGQVDEEGNQTVGGRCIGNIFSGSTRISSSQNIYANTSNTLTKKQTYVLLSKNQNRPFR